MTDFKNKVIIVTGASQGIGKELVYTLANEGAQVVAYARNMDKLTAICNDIVSKGQKAYPIKLDLLSEESIKGAVKKTLELFGTIDFLINDAGRMDLYSVEKTSTELFDEIMGVNIRGVFLLTKEVLPVMLKNNTGKIVNIGSTAGRRGYPEQSAYCASKHALVGFTKSLSLELRKTGVSVCIVAPGGVLTDMSKNLMASRGDTGKDDEWMTVKDVADGVMYVLNQSGAVFTDELVLRRSASEPWR